MKHTVIDFFSGGGGMSFGFHSHPDFEIVAAFDAQLGKPSSKAGSLQCNDTYTENMRLRPHEVNLAEIPIEKIEELVGDALTQRELDVMISCAPCTGFSRAKANNHIIDDTRNSLVRRSADIAVKLKPKIFLMENARELLKGNFTEHFTYLKDTLEEAGYSIYYDFHFLSKYGLPQKRERAIVIAVKNDYKLRTLDDLWYGYSIKPEAITVRRAIGYLPPISAGDDNTSDPLHRAPSLKESSIQRLSNIPPDGGSWIDLIKKPHGYDLLTPSMQKSVNSGKLGSYPDVYGRMKWDAPAITIKRECAHIGNGRYSHPEQDRLCTVREMGILQGFPYDYKFMATSLANMYRHIGDAVPPLISYQLAAVSQWILTGKKPNIKDCILDKTSLRKQDIISRHNVLEQSSLPLSY